MRTPSRSKTRPFSFVVPAAFFEDAAVFLYCFVEKGKAPVVAGLHQLLRIGLGIALIFSLKDFRERNVLDMPFAAVIDDALDKFVERMAYAGTAVVNARQLRMFPEIKYDVNDVFNVDEVANLAAVFVARRAGKQGDFTRFLQLVVFWKMRDAMRSL